METHPGLQFLLSTPEFHARYIETVRVQMSHESCSVLHEHITIKIYHMTIQIYHVTVIVGHIIRFIT